MTSGQYTCDLDQDTKTSLKIYLFRNVQNIDTLRNNVVKGVWNCAVVKPSLILDPFQVAVAANRALVAANHNTMVTRTVYGEMVYNLSLTKNISQSLSKFGVETERDALICFLVTPDKDESQDILSQIEGEIRPMSELSELTNVANVKTVYKLHNIKGDIDFLDVIVSRMVTKSFISH